MYGTALARRAGGAFDSARHLISVTDDGIRPLKLPRLCGNGGGFTPWQGAEKVFRAVAVTSAFSTLHKNWLLSLIFSPYGRVIRGREQTEERSQLLCRVLKANITEKPEN